MAIDTNGFWDAINREAKAAAAPVADTVFRLGTVDPGYGDATTGYPRVQFDGEDELDATITQVYPYVNTFKPAPNDRVVLGKIGNTWVILGPITSAIGVPYVPVIGEVVGSFVRTASMAGVNSGGSVILVWDTEVMDKLNGMDLVSAPTLWTCQYAGQYEISGGVGFIGSATAGWRFCCLRKNNVQVPGSGINSTSVTVGPSNTAIPLRTTTVNLAVNDTISVEMQTSLNTSTATGAYAPSMQIKYVGR